MAEYYYNNAGDNTPAGVFMKLLRASKSAVEAAHSIEGLDMTPGYSEFAPRVLTGDGPVQDGRGDLDNVELPDIDALAKSAKDSGVVFEPPPGNDTANPTAKQDLLSEVMGYIRSTIDKDDEVSAATAKRAYELLDKNAEGYAKQAFATFVLSRGNIINPELMIASRKSAHMRNKIGAAYETLIDPNTTRDEKDNAKIELAATLKSPSDAQERMTTLNALAAIMPAVTNLAIADRPVAQDDSGMKMLEGQLWQKWMTLDEKDRDKVDIQSIIRSIKGGALTFTDAMAIMNSKGMHEKK